ncbi:MAG TPA: ATP-binding protein [Thermoleophilaceae bacterium]|nr:ATP-binding protein [Thermoleophilaceae bacterium]
MIEARIDTRRPRLELRLEADKDRLPLVRQALRALAQATGTGAEELHDAELAVTEACANAIQHAYRHGNGFVDVTIEARAAELLVHVRDAGKGMRDPWNDRGRKSGLGLTVMESVAREVEIRSERGVGTEVVMALPGPDPERFEHADTSGAVAEQVVRRLVAMAAAQADMPPARVTEALLAAELIVRHVPEKVTGDCITVALTRIVDGIELRVGPLPSDGATEVLAEADVPMVGSVIERFADGVWAARDDFGPDEQLAVRFKA